MNGHSEQAASSDGAHPNRTWVDVFRARERRIALGAGAPLYEQGSPADGVWLIHEGSIELRLSTRQQPPVVLGQAVKGGLLALGAVLMQRPHDESAVTLTGVIAGFLPLDDFTTLFAENRDFRFEVLHRMSAGLQMVNQQIVAQRSTG
jgi:CRP-like cAMP-binding protein